MPVAGSADSDGDADFQNRIQVVVVSGTDYIFINIPYQTLLPLNKPIINMYAQATMGRGGYNRTSSLALGRGGYNRDVKASGISRPSNPSSLTVRSARAADDGRGGYN
ncbi:hypothetical protein E4T49_01171 [Aureobasidium sp. EXF-10728]|nr:hypothetical protein E4T49_01171 [Aureobasidium sp. EXF-10728]